jgi:hypothetical protein
MGKHREIVDETETTKPTYPEYRYSITGAQLTVRIQSHCDSIIGFLNLIPIIQSEAHVYDSCKMLQVDAHNLLNHGVWGIL